MTTRFGAFVLDSDLRQLTRDGHDIHLAPKAFDLLVLLMAQAGRVMTKAELHQHLWPDTFVTDATLVSMIKTLRRALGDNDARAPLIKTAHGVGYAFIAPIESQHQRSGARRVADSASGRVPSIAVLPFSDLSAGQDQAYLCEGIAEELIHALSGIEGLHVAARSSSFTFSNKGLDIRAIGASLNVDTILEGSVRTAGNRLRLTAQLVDVGDGYPLWSERYDRTLDNVFAVQDGIACAVVARLQATLRIPPRRTVGTRHVENLEAYSLYLQGRHHWSRRVKGSLQRAIGCFEQAIARDPSYALAYTGLADAYCALGMLGGLTPRAASSKAKPAAERAVFLNDNLSEAHQALAFVHFVFDWDFVRAEYEFERAIALNPHSGHTHSVLSYLLAVLGRFDEAVAAATCARALEPMSPLVGVNVATTLFLARRCDEGLDECGRVLELEPTFASAHWARSIVLTQLGRYDEALTAVAQAQASSFDFFPAAVGWIYAAAGQHDKAGEIMTALRARAPNESRYSLAFAWIAMARGEIDDAFEWLERAYEDRTPMLLWIGVARTYDALRGDSRFKTLLRKLGLERVAAG